MLFGKKPSLRTADNKKDQFTNPKILEVNLIKDEARVAYDWNKKVFSLLLLFMVAAALIGELYLGLGWWQSMEAQNAQALSAKVDLVNRDIAQIKNQSDAALTYQAKAVAAGQLLANHVYWTNFLRWLEKDTLSSVKFSGFSGDLSGSYKLSGNAPNFATVSWQAKALADDP